MKKILISVLLVTISLSMNAQIVASKSEVIVVTEEKKPEVKKEKKKRETLVHINFGLSADFQPQTYVGADFSFGIMKPIGTKGAFWHPEIGATTYGVYDKIGNSIRNDYGKSPQFAFYGTPIKFGWRFNISETYAIAPYWGLYAGVNTGAYQTGRTLHSYDASGNYVVGGSTYWGSRDALSSGFCLGTDFGVDLWIKKRFTLGIHYRQELIKKWSIYEPVYTINGDLNDIIDHGKKRPNKLVASFGILF